MLKTNDGKTEFLIIGSRQQLEKMDQCYIRVRDANFQPVSSARNLGRWFDSNLSMSVHVTKCGVAFFGCITLNALVVSYRETS